ncbi:MAG: amidohydrolase family protein, partial [Bacteroidales bacterium]|nr:amidohydrolase family protein [Bacteroidales bacterium]
IITHLCETKTEVDDCLKAHGCTPVEYLDSLGILGDDVIAAHCVHLTDNDIRILSERGVYVAHCPASNMKLGSGRFNYEKSGELKMTLGTDGASSNNNLDMREEMKLAAFYAKSSGNPETLPASEVLKWATYNGAKAFGIDAGEIAEGKLADCILVNLDDPKMVPCFNLTANWVYSADSSMIDTVICNGKVIMEHRHVPGEEDIIEAVKSRWKV